MKSRLLLDIVIRERSPVFQLFSRKNQTLLIRRNAFLVLDLCLHIGDCIRRLYIQCNGLSRQRLHKDLHTTSQSKYQVKSWFLLDIVISESSAILELLPRKDKSLLIGRNPFLILNLGLDIWNRVGRFHIQSDCLPSQSLNKNLHSSSESKHKVKSRLLLDIIICKSTTVLKLFPCKDQSLLIRGDAFLVLNLRLYIGDGVRRFHIQSNGLAG